MTHEPSNKLQDRTELQARLLDVEQRLATTIALEQRCANLREELETGDEAWREDLAAHRRELERLSWRLAETERMLHDVVSSATWRATKPLRTLRRNRGT